MTDDFTPRPTGSGATITPIKPNCIFEDTCGKPLGDNPWMIEAVEEVCAFHAIPTSALKTHSQFWSAFIAVADPKSSNEYVVDNCWRVFRILSKYHLALDDENDTRLAAMARRKVLMKIARGEPLGPNDTERVVRLLEQQGMLASPAP